MCFIKIGKKDCVDRGIDSKTQNIWGILNEFESSYSCMLHLLDELEILKNCKIISILTCSKFDSFDDICVTDLLPFYHIILLQVYCYSLQSTHCDQT